MCGSVLGLERLLSRLSPVRVAHLSHNIPNDNAAGMSPTSFTHKNVSKSLIETVASSLDSTVPLSVTIRQGLSDFLTVFQVYARKFPSCAKKKKLHAR